MSVNDSEKLIGYEIADLKEFPITQLDELETISYETFFNHTFSRPNAPDDKSWVYSGVTKDNSEIELDNSDHLASEQRGNYPPGSSAIPGVAARVTSMPSSGDAFFGYFNAVNIGSDNSPNEGFGFGVDGTGTFSFIAKGGTTRKVYQGDWNGPEADKVESDPFDKHYPRICRFPHLFYGGGGIRYIILEHRTDDDGVPRIEPRTVHIETPETVSSEGAPFNSGPPFNQPNLRCAFTVSSISGAALRANAAHYESGNDESERRVNGEHFTGTNVGTSGWTHLLSWQKRTDWEMVNVKPLKIFVPPPASNDVKLELQIDASLSNTSFSRATHSSDDETAVEVSTAGSISTNGERRWVGYSATGQGNQGSAIGTAAVDFNLAADITVTLAAQAVGGSTDVDGVVAWEEFF